jgi:transketolase
VPTAFAPLTSVIRALAMDAVQQANSGHPGMPMGMTDIAEVLWRRHSRHNPANPHWPDRNRFVLSNGHGSMLIYTLLHLGSYDVSIDDPKNFRQLGSQTPGHPEVGHSLGVETTIGPPGQGLANAVGTALAEQFKAAEFNRPGHEIVDHSTDIFLAGGCRIEGISHAACSPAGTPGLGKLTALHDDNGISIDAHVAGWFADDTPKRFEVHDWRVIATKGENIATRKASQNAIAAFAPRLPAGRASSRAPYRGWPLQRETRETWEKREFAVSGANMLDSTVP